MIKPSRSAIGSLGIGAALLVAVLQYEGYKDEAYIPVPGDVPTIGAGRTEGVKMGDTTNPVREMVYLLNNLEGKYGAAVRQCVKVPLHQHEFDALVDTAYNAGAGAVCREIAPRFNSAVTNADYAAACASIGTWRITVKGRDCRDRKNNCYGLVKRRAEERKTCEGG